MEQTCLDLDLVLPVLALGPFADSAAEDFVGKLVAARSARNQHAASTQSARSQHWRLRWQAVAGHVRGIQRGGWGIHARVRMRVQMCVKEWDIELARFYRQPCETQCGAAKRRGGRSETGEGTRDTGLHAEIMELMVYTSRQHSTATDCVLCLEPSPVLHWPDGTRHMHMQAVLGAPKPRPASS